MRICPQCRTVTTKRTCPHDGFQTVDKARYDPDRADPLIGTVFDERYRIEALLGRGGMGAVYRATQIAVNRPVALKLLRPELADDLKEVARFQQEARAVAALNHPNSIRLYDFGQADDGHLFLVMEYLEGEPLGAMMKREGALPPERVIHLGAQILESLAEAHAHGIVHRDLKPANLFLTEIVGKRDYVKVLDFGIAKVSGDRAAESRLTGTGIAIGSPRYIAPEQACGREVTGRSDLYALAAILYELLTGAPVFRRRTGTDYMIAHIKEEAPPPVRDGERLYGPLPDLIMACLAKVPAARPASAVEMLERLRAAADGPLTAAPTGAPGTRKLEPSPAPDADTRSLDPPAPAPDGGSSPSNTTDPSPTSTGRAEIGSRENPEASPEATAEDSRRGAAGGLPTWALAAAVWILLVVAGGGGALWWWSAGDQAPVAPRAPATAATEPATPKTPPSPEEAAESAEEPRSAEMDDPAPPGEAPGDDPRGAVAPPARAEGAAEAPMPDPEGDDEAARAPAEVAEAGGEKPKAEDGPARPDAEPPIRRGTLDSTPSGAAVFRDGERIGRTPLDYIWEGDPGEGELVLLRAGHRRRVVPVADLVEGATHTVRLRRKPTRRPAAATDDPPEAVEQPPSDDPGYRRLE